MDLPDKGPEKVTHAVGAYGDEAGTEIDSATDHLSQCVPYGMVLTRSLVWNSTRAEKKLLFDQFSYDDHPSIEETESKK